MADSMTRRQKLIARIRSRPPEADFDDVRKLLEEFGWTLDRTRGSHHYFVKRGEMPLPAIPTVSGRKVKRTYLTLIVERLGLDELED
jgi:predicted RNA binding protein YcfA (HicA-like mRNA interferase family)